MVRLLDMDMDLTPNRLLVATCSALHAEWHALGGISPWTEANINTPQTEGADNSQAEEECSWAPISFFVFFFGYD